MTRHDPAEDGAERGVGTHRNGTASTRRNEAPTGSYLRITGDCDEVAAEILEKLGPDYAGQIAWALVCLLGEVES